MITICTHCRWRRSASDLRGTFAMCGKTGTESLNHVDGRYYTYGMDWCSEKNQGDCKDYFPKFPWNILKATP